MKLFLDENFDCTFNSAAVQLNLTENFGHASAFIKQLTNYTGNERERG